MVQLTRNFTSEVPLHRDVIEAISAALEAGWADLRKISQASARASALTSASLEEMGAALHIPPSAIEPIGEPALLHQLAIEGYLSDGALLVTSNLDLGKIRAVAHHYRGPKNTVQSDQNGYLKIPSDFFAHSNHVGQDVVLSLQARNGEIGTTQNISSLVQDLPESVRIILDGTKSIPGPLHPRISAATFEATSWQGPAGIGFLAINNSEKFRYPLPHLALIRTPGTYSLPLLVGAVVALDRFKSEMGLIAQLRTLAALKLAAIPGVAVLGDNTDSNSRYLSIVVDNVIAEEVTQQLNLLGISIDAGSACSPDYLAPSHIITSLGFKSEGHLRITFNTTHTVEDVEALVFAINNVVRAKS